MKIEELKNLMIEIMGGTGELSEKIEYRVLCDFGEDDRYRLGLEYIEGGYQAPFSAFIIIPTVVRKNEVVSTSFSQKVVDGGNLVPLIYNWIKQELDKRKNPIAAEHLEELERILVKPNRGEE